MILSFGSLEKKLKEWEKNPKINSEFVIELRMRIDDMYRLAQSIYLKEEKTSNFVAHIERIIGG